MNKMDAELKQFIGLKWGVDVTEDQLIELGNGRIQEVRVLYPNSKMTRDLNWERVNVFVLEDDTITQVYMG